MKSYSENMERNIGTHHYFDESQNNHAKQMEPDRKGAHTSLFYLYKCLYYTDSGTVSTSR